MLFIHLMTIYAMHTAPWIGAALIACVVACGTTPDRRVKKQQREDAQVRLRTPSKRLSATSRPPPLRRKSAPTRIPTVREAVAGLIPGIERLLPQKWPPACARYRQFLSTCATEAKAQSSAPPPPDESKNTAFRRRVLGPFHGISDLLSCRVAVETSLNPEKLRKSFEQFVQKIDRRTDRTAPPHVRYDTAVLDRKIRALYHKKMAQLCFTRLSCARSARCWWQYRLRNIKAARRAMREPIKNQGKKKGAAGK
jgi:hypothetical protein